ncbi:MAG: low molecular weight phosphotyrosine protein phosphatase [Xanthomonadales bacterium]|nr:low molecular weight phosphotyrosine protein phosphatase [Xanthomonadales bacterium]
MQILFVCMGNICRSPLAAIEARRSLAAAGLDGVIGIDSAGTLDFHAGYPADARARSLATDHGMDLGAHRARQVKPADFSRFDLVIAMDRQNLATLRRLAPPQASGRIRLLLEFAGRPQDEVADPYSGTRADFDSSFSQIREGVAGLTKHLLRLHNAGHRLTE